ncbi:imidazolonepropionase [Propionispira arboris]|uniref:Imidazolonepropionase n=1 Tax=Propionispira arboris TaxID=84035 RepID=A0A1H7C387_9FIRM|nr:imidazolonepropionase [Propionispira arboris]SEJ84343.1 imidazolonepropionase [Propionispira arboris]
MEKLLIQNISQLVTSKGKSARHGNAMQQIEIQENAAIYIEAGIIEKVGNNAEVETYAKKNGDDFKIVNAQGKCAIPGFIDPHTHFLFGGSRADEFMDRLAGVPYLELLKQGGGICSTMQSTRDSSEESLYQSGRAVLNNMLKLGVTSVEGKSGYGLDKDTELKQLRVMHRLNQDLPISLQTTFLGAHAVPPEYKGNGDQYIDFLVSDVLTQVKKENLADFCDVFCEPDVFSLEQSERFLSRAAQMGFKLKMHADEINSIGGAALAHKLKAISADHLLAVTEADIQALSSGNTIAVLLPATAFCMRKPFAPARKMIDAGCAVALASDFNPGSCYTYSIPLILALAVISMCMTLEEALTAITLNAAAAIDQADSVGSIEPGKRADILLLAYPDYRFLVYHTGINIVQHVIKDGEFLW